MTTKLRWGNAVDRPLVQKYLFENMGKIPFERWANILDCRWIDRDDRYGVIVEKDAEIIGFLGIVFADRVTNGQSWRTGNITSWYVQKDLRRGGLGHEMLDFVTSEPDVTYVATSPNFRSGSLLKKIGWELLEDRRLFWHRSAEKSSNSIRLVSGFDEVVAVADPESRKILSDHRGLNVTPHWVTTKSGREFLVVTYTKMKGDPAIAHVEILHTSSVAALTRNVRAIAELLVPPKNAVLSADSRFVDADAIFDDEKRLEVPRYFKPCGQPARKVDFLYGEVVLLDLKLY